jgi:hypothetical protein
MKQNINEIKRMQQLAGLITEGEYRDSLMNEDTNPDVEFLNQHKEEIYDKFSVGKSYGVSRKRFLQGNFENSGPFMFHDAEGNSDSSIEFTLEPNEERNNDLLSQEEVEIDGKKFYLTTVKNY